MKFVLKLTFFFMFFLSATYYLYFYISPSITVKNESEQTLLELNVKLPNSNLNFGSIERGQKNTIYYELSQNDGSYQYSFKLKDKLIEGKCGFLTNDEINKRFVLIIDNNSFVSCRF